MVASDDRVQPGYDALADVYASRFPTAYTSAMERHDVAMFADEMPGPGTRIVDVGCGTGHVAADLHRRGFDVRGVDPSEQMLTHARRAYPNLPFTVGDAWLRDVDLSDVEGLVARLSLIHLPPDDVRALLRSWHLAPAIRRDHRRLHRGVAPHQPPRHRQPLSPRPSAAAPVTETPPGEPGLGKVPA
jgi:SAM-dependent methyltransferase